MRDYTKLKVFVLADELALDVYRATQDFPSEERFGLQSQMRRAAVSVSTNIVEGSARRTLREYVNFLGIAFGSAAEVRYQLTLSRRLGFMPEVAAVEIENRYISLERQLSALLASLSGPKAQCPKPRSEGALSSS